MTDKELAEIEQEADRSSENGDVKGMYSVCTHDVPRLIAEIRRLREAAVDNGPGAGFSVS